MTFGERLKAARGDLQLDDAAYLARQKLPRSLWFSRETLRRMEAGLIPEDKASPFAVAALASVYGVKVNDLSDVVSAGWTVLSDLVSANMACFSPAMADLVDLAS